MARLYGKTALITGGTSGIGLAAARLFLAEGARIAVTGANVDRLTHATAALPRHVVTIRCDAGEVAAQQQVADTLKEAFGKLDVVFINAGHSDFRPVGDWDETGFDRSVEVNLKGPFFLIQKLLPILRDPASIILNASINARIGMPNTCVYAATKAGLVSMARTLSGELIGRGIRVNTISPGPVATSMHDRVGLTGAALDLLIGQIPAPRRGTVEEIAGAVLFLASDESRFTVGSDFVIDGGMSNI